MPVRCLRVEFLLAQSRERIKLCAPVIFGLLPLGRDPAFLLQLVQRRIEGSFAYLQHIPGDGPQTQADGPPVQGLEREDLQEEEIEGALNQVVGFAHIGFLGENTKASLGKQGESSRDPQSTGLPGECRKDADQQGSSDRSYLETNVLRLKLDKGFRKTTNPPARSIDFVKQR